MPTWMPGAGHPAQLPWYVAGTLSGREARRVRGHLRRCHDCQERAAELAAERAALLGVARTDHPGVEDLVAFAEPDPALPAERHTEIARHLASCPACGHERDLLAEAEARPLDATAPAAIAPRAQGLVRWARPAAAAAASIVLVALGFLAGRSPRPPEAAQPIRPIATATLLPAHRGGDLATVLTAPGPWAVTVALPFGAPVTPYRSSVQTPAGERVASGAVASLPDREGNVHLLLEPLPAAGDYVLVLEPAEPTAEAARYPFRVLAGDAAPPEE